jgi:hypothetical protein
LIAATTSSERIEPLPAHRAPMIVVNPMPRRTQAAKSPPSSDQFRGRIIDILV